ncbi:peptide chain release factor 3 [soil metagenome]
MSSSLASSPPANREISRRRTFAIISHPDAGKTTLTEKFLLYGGALQLAGSVTARKNQRATASDWMEMEKQRGISVSSTVLQFEYKDCVINLLDTPGHRDFSEDTYRVLTAVDAAVMVIDAGNGIEAQTLKLFEVCRRRGVPIFTFINKMDRPAIPPLKLLDELETVLGIASCPINWPLGDGRDFKGVFNREDNTVHMFERVTHGAHRAPVSVSNFHDPIVKSSLPEHIYKQASDELELLDEAGEKFSEERIRAGKVTPVFFGSAANNFGVQMMLDRFLTLAPPPAPRSSKGHQVLPSDPGFSGFIFKIQANMNPKHRDRVAFIRIVSGEFKRDMNVINTRSQKPIRLANSQRLFAQERETVDTAWAGDVVGIVGNNDFLIGDTLADDSKIAFDEMPRFAPECFAWLHNSNTAKFKRFREGLDQLLKEGLAQVFELFGSTQRLPLLGAVGPLQFEVLKYRLESEYGAECRIETTSWSHIRWFRKKNAEPDTPSSRTQRPDIAMSMNTTLLIDSLGNWVTVFPDKLSANYFESKNSDLFEVSSYPF